MRRASSVDIEGPHAMEWTDARERAELMTALLAAAANDNVGDRGREMLCRDSSRRSRAKTRDRARIHQRQNAAVRRVEQGEHTLDGRQFVTGRIAGKFGVDLRGEHRSASSGCQTSGFHMETAARHMDAEDRRTDG